jgi:hypothetical protein
VTDLEHEARVDPSAPSGVSRRTLIKRGVIAGGLVWAAPAISTVGRAAAQTAVGTAPCDCSFCATVNVPPPVNITLYFDCDTATSEECDCLCKCGGIDRPCSQADPCTVTIVCTQRETPC